MNGALIHHNGNHYIVVEDDLIDGDVYVTINKNMVHVYYTTKKYEYPITVYKLDGFNRGRILQVFRNLL
jgi:hypothetical protein